MTDHTTASRGAEPKSTVNRYAEENRTLRRLLGEERARSAVLVRDYSALRAALADVTQQLAALGTLYRAVEASVFALVSEVDRVDQAAHPAEDLDVDVPSAVAAAGAVGAASGGRSGESGTAPPQRPPRTASERPQPARLTRNPAFRSDGAAPRGRGERFEAPAPATSRRLPAGRALAGVALAVLLLTLLAAFAYWR